MKQTSLFFLAICILPFGCVKEAKMCCVPYQIYYLKAKVIQTSDISCSKPVLDFSEDSSRIRSLTQANDMHYVVINLPSGFNIKDKNLYVSVTTLKTEEEFACTTVGPAFPHLKIADVKDR